MKSPRHPLFRKRIIWFSIFIILSLILLRCGDDDIPLIVSSYIIEPEDDDAFLSNEEIDFICLAGSKIGLVTDITWTSSVDGVIGDEFSFDRSLSAGKHRIKCKAEDNWGIEGEDAITIYIYPP